MIIEIIPLTASPLIPSLGLRTLPHFGDIDGEKVKGLEADRSLCDVAEHERTEWLCRVIGRKIQGETEFYQAAEVAAVEGFFEIYNDST